MENDDVHIIQKNQLDRDTFWPSAAQIELAMKNKHPFHVQFAFFM